MRKYVTSRFLLIMASLLLTLSFFYYLFSQSMNKIKEVFTPVSSFVYHAENILSTPITVFSQFTSNVSSLFDTYAENQQLKVAITKLENQEILLSALESENQSLKEVVGMKENLNANKFLTTKVISRSPVSWLSSLKIKNSVDSNLSEGMLVLANGGLVGQITSLTPDFASISLLTDAKQAQQIPVKIKNTDKEVFAILSGFDESKQAFVLNQLSVKDSVEKGSDVVTSGLDGKTQSELPVGKVVSVENAADSLSKNIYVTPTADFSKIEFVSILGE